MSAQGELLPLSHRSLQQDRLRKRDQMNPERVYAAEWLRRNRETPTMLALILAQNCQGLPPVSRRDAAVAASIVQWLGTNVGLGFLMACERKIVGLFTTTDTTRRVHRGIELARNL